MEWIVSLLLKLILARLEKLGRKTYIKIQEDKKRGVVDEKNIKKHLEATTRAEKIKASLGLLNGTNAD